MPSFSRRSLESPRKKSKHQDAPATPPAEDDERDDVPMDDAQKEEKISSIGDRLQNNLGDKQQQDEYDIDRKKLLEKEKTESWDKKSRDAASEAQIQADEIVRKIREHERDNLFGNKATEQVPGPDKLDMGGQFLTNKQRIEQDSQLFNIAHRMPKGAHLHAHFNAELEVDLLLNHARDMDTMFIRSTQSLLKAKDYLETEIVFTVLPKDHPEVDPFSEDYKPEFKAAGSNPWMKWKNFQRKFQAETQRRELKKLQLGDAEAWVKSKMILQEEEVYGKSQTVNGIWARFNQATRCIKGLLNYDTVYRWYVREAMVNMVKNGVMYAELRPMLMDKTIPSADGLTQIDLEGQMKIIQEEIDRFKSDLDKEGRLSRFPFGIKIIYCTPRSIPKAKMRSELADCIRLKIKFPELICGFDLVGAEDRPNPISFYRDELLSFIKTCEQLNIKIPFLFHAGETLLDTGGTKDPENSNLYESVLLNAARVGHGFALTKHPKLIEDFKEKDICIELCPVSNELLHLCRNVKEHPYPEILAAGIPCTVNADNPTLFRATMSHEFYQVMVGTPTMSVHGWRQLAQWSIEYSCLKTEDKSKALEIFRDDWEDFCQWIVQEYELYASRLEVEGFVV